MQLRFTPKRLMRQRRKCYGQGSNTDAPIDAYMELLRTSGQRLPRPKTAAEAFLHFALSHSERCTMEGIAPLRNEASKHGGGG
jgi:hypothetical protein